MGLLHFSKTCTSPKVFCSFWFNSSFVEIRWKHAYFFGLLTCLTIVVNTETFTWVDSVKYLGATINKNLRSFSHVQNCIKKPRLRPFQVKRNTNFIFVYQCANPIPVNYSPVFFAGLLKKYFRLLPRGLGVDNGGSFMKEIPTSLCDMLLSACEKFAQKIFSDPSHPPYNGLSKCRFQALTRSAFLPIPSVLTNHRDKFSYIPWIFINRVTISDSYISFVPIFLLSILMRR